MVEEEEKEKDADARADGAARVGASRATRPARECARGIHAPTHRGGVVHRDRPRLAVGQIQIPVVRECFIPVVAPVARQRGAVEYRSG